MNYKEVIEDIEYFYEAAFAALCHCNKNPEGAFPVKCSCQTEKVQEALELISEIKDKLTNKYKNKNSW